MIINAINGIHRSVGAILVIARDGMHWNALMHIAGRHKICPYGMDHHGIRRRTAMHIGPATS